MPMWVVDYDNGDGECTLLVAGPTAEYACAVWEENRGEEPGSAAATPARWAWPAVPEPAPTVDGIWWGSDRRDPGTARTADGHELFRGYDCYWLGDPTCDSCGERVDELDMAPFPQVDRCRWCAETDAAEAT